MKRYLYLFIILVVSGLVIFAGCDLDGGGDGDGEEEEDAIEVGDEIGGGFVVTKVDAGGGYTATRTIDGNDDGDLTDSGDFKDYLYEGEFHTDMTWKTTEDNVEGASNDGVSVRHYLGGTVFIGNNSQTPADAKDVTLTIDPGARIYGQVSASNPGALVITRGADIDAEGTSSNPIIFDSAKNAVGGDGGAEAGDWGGIIINGYAQVQGDYKEGEGGTGQFGGGSSPNNTDSSGTLKYVQVRYAGTLFSPDNELNGISFNAVGSGTTVEYIQVHKNADDGIEFFGGTVQVKYYVGTFNQDDSIDGDDSWFGSVQHAIIVHDTDKAGSLLEMDGDAPADSNDFDESKAILANISGIATSASSTVLRFKNSANYDVYNSVFDASRSKDSDGIPVVAVSDSGASENKDGIEYFGVEVVGAPDNTVDGEDYTAFPTESDVAADAPFAEYFNAQQGSDGNVRTKTATPLFPYGGTEFALSDFAAAPSSATAQSLPSADPAGNALDDTTYVGAYDGTAWWSGWANL